MTRELAVISPAPPEERDQEIFRKIAVEGRDITAVAREHQLSPQHVRRIVRVTQRQLALRSLELDTPAVREMHLLRLEHQWQEAMVAWYRSQLGEQKLKINRKGEKEPPELVESTKTESCGDVGYLEYAREVLGEMRQLGGIPDLSQQGLFHDHVEQLTFDERRARFDQLLETLRQRARTEAADRAADGRAAVAAVAD
jgi:hypothetical protein